MLLIGLWEHGSAARPDTVAICDFLLPEELSRQTVYSSTVDRRGIAYFGVEDGLLEFDGLEWRFIAVRPGVAVTHLEINSAGRVFAAGPGELGYLLVDETGGTVYESLTARYDFLLSAGRPKAFLPLGTDMLFVDEQQLFVYESRSRKVRRQIFETGIQIEAAALFRGNLFLNDRQSGLLSALPEQLLREGADAAEVLSPVPGGSGLRIRNMQPMGRERLLITTISQGTLQLRAGQHHAESSYVLSAWPNEAEAYFSRYPISASSIFNDVVAFGSHGGGIVLLYQNGSLKQHIGTPEGLRENFVFSLLFTSRGRLWAGMNGGVASVLVAGMSQVPAEETDPAAGQSVQEDSAAADTLMPALPERTGPGFVRRAWNGFTAWVADVLPGYGVVTPLDFSEHNPDDFTTILRSVRETKGDSLIFRGAFSRELYGVQELAQADTVRHVFPADLNAFRFSYATNRFEEADQIQHQVMLEGLDTGWSNWSTNTYREYTNLRFGAYQFRVRSMNPDGEVSVESAFRFQIRPPWHQAGWFYIIQLAMIIAMLGISFYLNKTGRAFTVSQFLIYLVIIITFEYVLVYSQPIFHSFTQGIAFFEIALSVLLVICLTPVEEGYRWVLNKLTGLTAEELVERRKKREAAAQAAGKKAGFLHQITAKGRLKR